MQRKLRHNPHFWLSIVLVLILAGVWIYRGVFAQTRAGWTPPTADPPGGQPAPPLDTSSADQLKTGDLSVGMFRDPLGADRRAVTLRGADAPFPAVRFQDGTGAAVAEIRLWGGRLQARNTLGADDAGRWFDLGGGNRGFWTDAPDGRLYHDEGEIGIGVSPKIGFGSLQVRSGGIRNSILLFNGSSAIDRNNARLWKDSTGVHMKVGNVTPKGILVDVDGTLHIPRLELGEAEPIIVAGRPVPLIVGGWYDTGHRNQCDSEWGNVTETGDLCSCDLGTPSPNPNGVSQRPILCLVE